MPSSRQHCRSGGSPQMRLILMGYSGLPRTLEILPLLPIRHPMPRLLTIPVLSATSDSIRHSSSKYYLSVGR
jgi:hypothetical protein